MIISEPIESLCVVSQRLYHIVSDVLFSLNIEEGLDIVVNFLKLSPLDEESEEEFAVGFEYRVDLSQVVVLVWVVEETLDIEGVVNAESRD
jgi:hypothetical protein